MEKSLGEPGGDAGVCVRSGASRARAVLGFRGPSVALRAGPGLVEGSRGASEPGQG